MVVVEVLQPDLPRILGAMSEAQPGPVPARITPVRRDLDAAACLLARA
jgi:hypothetical protein